MTRRSHGALTWWEQQRWKYNLGILAAGPCAFILYTMAVWSWVPEPEITAFSVLGQGVMYLLMMVAANLCYLLGPASEGLFRPKNRQRYRTISFALGLAFSVAIPFLAPLQVFLTYGRATS